MLEEKIINLSGREIVDEIANDLKQFSFYKTRLAYLENCLMKIKRYRPEILESLIDLILERHEKLFFEFLLFNNKNIRRISK